MAVKIKTSSGIIEISERGHRHSCRWRSNRCLVLWAWHGKKTDQGQHQHEILRKENYSPRCRCSSRKTVLQWMSTRSLAMVRKFLKFPAMCKKSEI